MQVIGVILKENQIQLTWSPSNAVRSSSNTAGFLASDGLSVFHTSEGY